jgi:hypothetical protein
MRCTKPAQIYKKTGYLRAVKLLGTRNWRVRSAILGIEVDDALSISEHVEL